MVIHDGTRVKFMDMDDEPALSCPNCNSDDLYDDGTSHFMCNKCKQEFDVMYAIIW